MHLFTGQQWRHRYREQTCGQSHGRRGREELKEKHWNRYITTYKTDSQREFLYDTGGSLKLSALKQPRGVK